mgnify:CR=1 FL=1
MYAKIAIKTWVYAPCNLKEFPTKDMLLLSDSMSNPLLKGETKDEIIINTIVIIKTTSDFSSLRGLLFVKLNTVRDRKIANSISVEI